MTKAQALHAKADQFAARAAASKLRTMRNAFHSLESACRALADKEERSALAAPPPANAN